MTRRIFTIVAAHPVDVQSHELPRVRVDTYLVEGDELKAAFGKIADYEGVVDATEVLGRELDHLVLTPITRLQKEETLEQWTHWRHLIDQGELEDSWTPLARGPESFQQRRERKFAEANPHLA
ncbi:hypothetical protein [Comamonas thiooxydans]|uniref:hypothetical protein n=1 Tax=Comamonas thiooxydans TaxID=363952 RepID=UPI000B410860|nr:hypothetical protein [Comamonas thiooxydans]